MNMYMQDGENELGEYQSDFDLLYMGGEDAKLVDLEGSKTTEPFLENCSSKTDQDLSLKDVRKQFVKNVFGTHSMQIFVFVLYILYCQMNKESITGFASNTTAFIVNLISALAVAVLLMKDVKFI